MCSILAVACMHTSSLFSILLMLCSDALPFRMLAEYQELCKRTTFVDVDYDTLLRDKVGIIRSTEQLRLLLDDVEESPPADGFLLRSKNYAALACDLRDVERLDRIIHGAFDSSAAFLVICEVSITYMDPQDANAILRWASSLGNGKLSSFVLRLRTLLEPEISPYLVLHLFVLTSRQRDFIF